MCCRRAASTIAQKPQFLPAIKASFSHQLLARKRAGFGTLSSQSGCCARYLGRPLQDRRPFFFIPPLGCTVDRTGTRDVVQLCTSPSPSGLGEGNGPPVHSLIIKAAIFGRSVAAISAVACGMS